MKKYFVCIIFLMFLHRITAQPPVLYTFNQSQLQQAKLDYRASKPKAAIQNLLEVAGKSLNNKQIYSVVNKNHIPPSGNKHDYMSLAPYWFPDSTKKDGLPYIRKDGVRNPEAAEYTDGKQLNRMCNSVQTLALAYYFTENMAYAEKAQHLLQAWFVDSALRMNPNMLYAQAIKGRNDGKASGVIETRAFIDMLDAVDLLAQNKAFDSVLYSQLQAWFVQYLAWLDSSQIGQNERNAKNNHGSWFVFQYARYAFFVGDKARAKAILETLNARIAWQIEPDGKQPLELVRTKSLSYSLFNLMALVQSASMAKKVGVDVWSHQTADGRSIKKACDYILPYAFNPETWPEKQISKLDREELYVLLRILLQEYPTEPNYQRWMHELEKEFASSIYGYIY